jgi:hypothetical protein
MKISLFIRLFGYCLAASLFNNILHAKDETKPLILQGVRDGIQTAQLEPEVSQAIDKVVGELTHQNIVSDDGCDDKVRPVYVSFQGLIEASLSNYLKENPEAKLQVFFHTPAPPTPFCLGDEKPTNLMHPSIESNKGSQKTVISRKQTTQSLLMNGAKIVNIFPESGLKKRTETQVKNYETVKQRFNDRFFDIRTKSEVDKGYVGATYILTDKAGDKWLFSIRSSQVNSPKEAKDRWQLVLGPISDKDVQAFYIDTFEYLMKLTEGKIQQYLLPEQ